MKPVLRVLIASTAAVLLSGAAWLGFRSAVSAHLRSTDPGASFSQVRPGAGVIFLTGVSLPERGLSAESVWVFIDGAPFSPTASRVVICGGSWQGPSPGSSGEPAAAPAGIGEFSADGIAVPGDFTLFVSRRNGTDLVDLTGPGGTVVFRRCGELLTGVFQSVSSLPLVEWSLPPFLEGHHFSGVFTASSGDPPVISGSITAFDGAPAAALFEYSVTGGRPRAEFTMDFSQVGQPALAVLDSLSRGAVMTAVPTGSLQVYVAGSDTVHFDAALGFDSVSIYSSSIAPDTFSTSASLDCSGFAVPSSCMMSVEQGFLLMGEAGFDFSLNWSWGERRMLLFHAYNDSLSGEAITASIPPELMGRLRGLSLYGDLDFDITLLLDWDHPDSSDVSLDIDASGLRVGWSPVSFSSLMDPAGGAVCTMRDSWGNTAVIPLDTLNNADFIVFDSMPACFEPLLCSAEDATFRRHHGFSEYHIRNSIRADMEQGRFVRGGSTITMQLAKNLFLGREKTLARKLQEVFLTWRLEQWLSKDRILEIYGNIVELGPGVFGFNSAGMYYFGRPFPELSVRETAFLVSILPGPSVYHRFGVRGEVPQYWNSYIDRLITICGNRGWIGQAQVGQALGDTLVFSGPVRFFGTAPGGSQSN